MTLETFWTTFLPFLTKSSPSVSQGEIMSHLLKDICGIHPEVSRVLEEAQLRTDSDLRSLTREDLNELFPGAKMLKLRRTLFDKIHKQKPINVLIRELKDFIPHDSFRAALTNNGVLVDYLSILKDMRTQMDHIRSFLDAHINLLEQLAKKQPEQKSDKYYCEGFEMLSSDHRPSPSTSHHVARVPTEEGCQNELDASGQGVANTVQTAVHPQRSQSSFPGARTLLKGRQQECNTGPTAMVMYQSVVKGKTFGAERQLMEKVIRFDPDRVRIEYSGNGQILIVFCPISSRAVSDIEAAMVDVQDDKPVILVLMHHSRQPSTAKISYQNPKVVLLVSVFYHDSIHGLVPCTENNDAVSKIQNKLLEYSTPRSQDTLVYNASGDASDVRSPVGYTTTSSNGSGDDNMTSKSGSKSWWDYINSHHN